MKMRPTRFFGPLTAEKWDGRSFARCLAIAWLAALIATFGYGRDQAIYGVVARAMLAGGAPYRDAWDFKPPGIHFLYALSGWALGPEAWAIRALEVGGLVATVLAYTLWSRLLRRYPVAVVAPFALLVPFVGALSSAVVFGERFGALRLVGMACVLLGLAVIVLPALRSRPLGG